MRPYVAAGPLPLVLGAQRLDLRTRALVMGVLNRTPDSFYAPAATFAFGALLRRADLLVAQGADILDIGGVKAGPGPEVSPLEELDRVVPVVEELHRRFDVPLSVDTWRAEVAGACYGVGAVVGNDISGFADPDYLPTAARAGATVVATHIRLRPRVADPQPVYTDVTATVRDFLSERWLRAQAAGVGAEHVIIDAGLDLGKTTAHSATLLRESATLAQIGPPLLLSASNKGFLGDLFSLAITDRREASLAAAAVGILGGCRVLRVHDVLGTVRVRDVLARVLGEAAAAGTEREVA